MTGRLAPGELRFTCSTAWCDWSAWVGVALDADGPAREVLVPGGRPACPVCGCRTLPDWVTGARLPLEERAS